MENINISIIVPIYNISEYIHECIRPLLENTFLNYEIILVNDGSTDNSLDIISKLSTISDKIKVINKDNGGLSSARNAGLKEAKGKYIFFLDGDDFIPIESIGNMYLFAEENELDIAIGNGRYYFGEGDKKNNYFVQGKTLKNKLGIYTGEEILEYMINKNCYKMEVWDKLYSRKLLNDNKISFKEGLLHEDELFTPIVFKHAKKVSYFGNIEYNYRQRKGSINQTAKLQNCIDYLTIADEFYNKCYKDKSIGQYFTKRILQQYLRAMQLSLRLTKEEYKEFIDNLKNSNITLINENVGVGISFRIFLFKNFKCIYKLLYINYRKIRFFIVGKV